MEEIKTGLNEAVALVCCDTQTQIQKCEHVHTDTGKNIIVSLFGKPYQPRHFEVKCCLLVSNFLFFFFFF